MKKINYLITTLTLFLFINLINVHEIGAQTTNSGPRFGITVLTPGLLGDVLNGDRELGEESEVDYTQREAIMSQFGWQWETILKKGSEFDGIVEWIAFVGGLERGTIVPSLSALNTA